LKEFVGYQNTQGTQQGIKYGTPHVCWKQPAIGDPKRTNNMSAAQGANDKLYLARALWRGLRHDRRLGRHLSVSPEPPRRHQRRPTPRGTFPPRPRGTWNPQARWGATGTPDYGTRSIDMMDMTVHSQQGHQNHPLTQHDPGHSTTTTSIPPQQQGWWQLHHLTPSLRKSQRTCRPPSWHRGIQVKAWPQHVALANREAKRSTPRTTPRYKEAVPAR
jgi:hypothetical protein